MNRYSFLFLVLTILFTDVIAQQSDIVPCLIGKDGVLINKREIIQRSKTTSTVKISTDTISPEQAKSVYALNLLRVSGRLVDAVSVAGFEVRVINGGDTLSATSNTAVFSPEVRKLMNEIKPNSIVYFENIRYWYEKNKVRAPYIPLYIK